MMDRASPEESTHPGARQKTFASRAVMDKKEGDYCLSGPLLLLSLLFESLAAAIAA